MVKEVAKRIVNMLEQCEMLWMIERGRLDWVSVIADKPKRCGAWWDNQRW